MLALRDGGSDHAGQPCRGRALRAQTVSVLVPLAILAAACSSPSLPPATGDKASPGSAAASTAASPGANAGGGCATSALRASLGPSNGAAGSGFVPVRFTNTSSTSCTLFGYPGVSLVVSPGGSQVGNAADRRQADPSLHAHTVTLGPGQVAHAVLQINDYGAYPKSRCRPASAPYLRVYPPGQTAPLYIRERYEVNCASTSVTLLHVSPVQPGSSPPGWRPSRNDEA